jgi:ABC-2 type transport system ATP-binding protein
VGETAAIEVTGLTRRFGGRTAVDEVTFAGIPVTADGGEPVRQRISVMPEAPGLYLKLSVAENLDYFTSGLDPAAAHEVLGLIGSLRDRGVTVFLTTHRLDEAEQLCDRVAIMNTTLCTIGRPDELRRTRFSRSLAVATAAPLANPDAVFQGLPAVQSWRQELPGREQPGYRYTLTVTDPAQAAPAVTRALVGADADVLRVAEERASLEDVYLQLVNDGKNGKAAG